MKIKRKIIWIGRDFTDESYCYAFQKMKFEKSSGWFWAGDIEAYGFKLNDRSFERTWGIKLEKGSQIALELRQKRRDG